MLWLWQRLVHSVAFLSNLHWRATNANTLISPSHEDCFAPLDAALSSQVITTKNYRAISGGFFPLPTKLAIALLSQPSMS